MTEKNNPQVLVIDVGGSHVKLTNSVTREPRQFDSDNTLAAEPMVRMARDLSSDWHYDVVSIGIPGPVSKGRLVSEPPNLGPGWINFDFNEALGKPVRIINDAAMQALGCYQGGRMLFLGLGTGLGSALIEDSLVLPLELAHLPYRDGMSYEEYVGNHGLDRLGQVEWERHVLAVLRLFQSAFLPDEIVLGGGNVRLLNDMPEGCRRGSNSDAFTGGFRMWND